MRKLTRRMIVSTAACLFALPGSMALPCAAAGSQASEGAARFAAERLGTVSFSRLLSESVGGVFNRGVALLHDFWYDEARRQFERIAQAEPECAMAHWGIAMSAYHQIWDRPDAATMAHAWEEMQRAAASPRRRGERAYIAALSRFFEPGAQDYRTRVEAYSAAMRALYRRHPHVRFGRLLRALPARSGGAGRHHLAPDTGARRAHSPVLGYPDHPGLAHYIIHACDTPSLAPQGLAAARRYGEIAPAAPHAVHMPGHIFARLGMWREDIESNLASVAASQAAQARRESDGRTSSTPMTFSCMPICKADRRRVRRA